MTQHGLLRNHGGICLRVTWESPDASGAPGPSVPFPPFSLWVSLGQRRSDELNGSPLPFHTRARLCSEVTFSGDTWVAQSVKCLTSAQVWSLLRMLCYLESLDDWLGSWRGGGGELAGVCKVGGEAWGISSLPQHHISHSILSVGGHGWPPAWALTFKASPTLSSLCPALSALGVITLGVIFLLKKKSQFEHGQFLRTERYWPRTHWGPSPVVRNGVYLNI